MEATLSQNYLVDKKLMLSDFCNSMAKAPFPTVEEISEVIQYEDKDIDQLCL